MVIAKSVATKMPFLWIACEADDKAAEHFLKATKDPVLFYCSSSTADSNQCQLRHFIHARRPRWSLDLIREILWSMPLSDVARYLMLLAIVKRNDGYGAYGCNGPFSKKPITRTGFLHRIRLAN